MSSQIKALGWHHATRNPHGTACAASGHARLGYAGGSWRSSEPFEIGDPKAGRILDRQFFTREFGKRGNRYGGNDANNKRHIRPWLLDMLGKRARVVIYGMGVDRAVGMSVSNEMAVNSARMVKCKAEVIMAGISGRRFRCGNTDALERKGHRRRHHYDDGKASQKWLVDEAQRSGSREDRCINHSPGGYLRQAASRRRSGQAFAIGMTIALWPFWATNELNRQHRPARLALGGFSTNYSTAPPL
jgi:hypothetical protein